LDDVDFSTFLWLYNQTQGYSIPDIHLEMSDWLEDTDAATWRILQAYRYSGKTHITNLWVVWKLLRDPNYRILILSATSELAYEKCGMIQTVIEEFYLTKHLRP